MAAPPEKAPVAPVTEPSDLAEPNDIAETGRVAEASARWRRSDVVTAAVIAGVAAIAGAGVGAFATYESNSKAQDRADKRAASADVARARGVARVLQAHYGTAATVIDVMLVRNRYTPNPELTAGLPYDDEKELAASVSSGTWALIADADAALRSLAQLIAVNPMSSPGPTGRRLLEGNLIRAGDALSPITGVK